MNFSLKSKAKKKVNPVPGVMAFEWWGRQQRHRLRFPTSNFQRRKKKDRRRKKLQTIPIVLPEGSSLRGCRFFGRRTPVPLGVQAATARGRYRGEPGSSNIYMPDMQANHQ